MLRFDSFFEKYKDSDGKTSRDIAIEKKQSEVIACMDRMVQLKRQEESILESKTTHAYFSKAIF